jgi:hypothetical protein
MVSMQLPCFSTLVCLALVALLSVTNTALLFAMRRKIKRDIRDRIHMAADEFIARAIERAQAAQQLQRATAGQASPAGQGIFVVGSNITIMNNVSNSAVAPPEPVSRAKAQM